MIAIKDMEMPKTCTMCWLSPMCKVHGEQPEWLGYDTRMEGCPLVEIVTCSDCRYFGNKVRIHDTYVCNKLGVYMPMDGYCSEGKQNESS